MQLEPLRYFVAAAEELSFSRAALRAHVTQPALSRAIARLERELGVELFERKKQRVHLSPAGRALLPRARRILCDVETTVQQLREEFSGARRGLRLGFLAPFLDDLVAPAVRALRRRAPRAKVALFELAPRAQLERLLAGELDLALLGNLDDAERERVRVKRLVRHPLAAVLPAEHPLARRKALALQELTEEPFLSLAESAFPGRRAALARWTAEAGFEPDLAGEHESLPLLLAAVAAGEGVALLPRHAAKLPHAGSVFVRLAPALETELLAVTRRGERPAELVALEEELVRHAAALTRDAEGRV